jgi:CDP-diacylglycerol--glycerol-3-phosphate 3-phosphatidyltransferase
VPSIYALKPAFQKCLRPIVAWLARAGVRANHVTLTACTLSIVVGVVLIGRIEVPRLLLILPAFLFVRMAMNAMDGMLAREFGQKTDLGAYLNELTDVVSDSFLYLPFAYLPPFEPLWIGVVICLSIISEMAGVIGIAIGAHRRYDGPMGKSDRAFVFGAVALWIGLGGRIFPWLSWAFPGSMAALLTLTIVNRVRSGLAEKKPARASTARVA